MVFVVHDSAFLTYSCITYYQFFKFDENYWGGGGGKNDMFCPPPKKKKIPLGGGGGGRPAPQLPQDRRLWGQSDLDEQGGMCYSDGSRICKKKRGGRKKFVREGARPHTGWGLGGPAVGAPWRGCRGKRPCRGAPGGGAPGSSRVFQQIRAFKIVVRSDRKCKFLPRCNFAYRASCRGSGGAGSHQIFP